MKKINDNLVVFGVVTAETFIGEIEITPLLAGEIATRINAATEPLEATLSELSVDIERRIEATTASLKEQIAVLAAEYNKAIEVINDLSERVTALESNYDPTVIK